MVHSRAGDDEVLGSVTSWSTLRSCGFCIGFTFCPSRGGRGKLRPEVGRVNLDDIRPVPLWMKVGVVLCAEPAHI